VTLPLKHRQSKLLLQLELQLASSSAGPVFSLIAGQILYSECVWTVVGEVGIPLELSDQKTEGFVV
jgi:hypothetical protein